MSEPGSVRVLDLSEAATLAGLAAVFEDLQYALRCCEHLVAAFESGKADAVFVEALWTGALTAYARCFSARTSVLTAQDVESLDLGAEVPKFHEMMRTLRDHYASRHVNPREEFTIGVAQANDGTPTGVAVLSTPRPQVDDATVRTLGRVGYHLAELVDKRMQDAQAEVLAAAGRLSASDLAHLKVVHLQVPA